MLKMITPDTIVVSNRKSGNFSKWVFARKLGLMKRASSGCFLFNPSHFAPIRTDSSCREVEKFIYNKEKQILNEDAFKLFVRHKILIPAGLERETSRINHQKTDLKGFMPALIFADFKTNSIRQLPVLLSKISSQIPHQKKIYLDMPVKCLRRSLNILNLSPQSIFIKCTIPHILTHKVIANLERVIEQGYRPNLKFNVYRGNNNRIRRDLNVLADKLGQDNFTFSFVPTANSADNPQCLPLWDDIRKLIIFTIHHKKIGVSQWQIYIDMKNRIFRNAFLSFGNCANKTYFLNQDNKIYECRRGNLIDINHINKAKKLSTNFDQYCFGRQKFAQNNCVNCVLLFLCGGVCDCFENGISELNCDMKKYALMLLFEQATHHIANKTRKKSFHFKSGNGKLDIIRRKSA